ncbi:MAG: hypothetical protein ABI760_05430, partial [Ferruginibacter sp.]
MNYYVSKSGSIENDGSIDAPLLTIQSGIDKLKDPGDTLIIGGGNYAEYVEIKDKHGKKSQPINVIGIEGETVNIDGLLEDFWEFSVESPAEEKWVPALTTDIEAHPEEYVSREKIIFTEDISLGKNGIKGAFLDGVGNKYTRLINHSTIRDLRSVNEKFGKITDPPDTDNYIKVLDKDGVPKTLEDTHTEYYYPLFFMGPGIWLNRDPGNENYGKIHIRLSHTHNNVPGLTDYSGETDPNKIGLAISKKNTNSLFVHSSEYLVLSNISIRFGGENSVDVKGGPGIRFDQVRFCCSEVGVSVGTTKGLEIKNCEFDGGLPQWFFRSDRKSEYYYKKGTSVFENKVGSQTSSALLAGANNNTGLVIQNCEFRNGHDLKLPGDVDFHHNLITNMN